MTEGKALIFQALGAGRQKDRRWMYATSVQMHPHHDAETLDDIVVTYSGQDGVKR